MKRRTLLAATAATLLAGRVRAGHGVHGMIVLPGRNGVWLSHLPLFRAPHAAQVIVRATLQGAATVGSGLHTFEPESFDLDALLAGRQPALKGTLVRGHFERGGTPIARDVHVKVGALVYAQRLDANETRPARLRYLLFGDASEMYAAHLVTRPPDFEQILRVRSVTPAPEAAALERGEQLIVPGRTDTIDARLAAGATVKASLMVVGGSRAPERPVEVVLGDELYHETADLAG